MRVWVGVGGDTSRVEPGPSPEGQGEGAKGLGLGQAAPTVLEDYDVVHASADSTFSMRDAKCEGVRDPGCSVDKGWQASRARRSTGNARGRSAESREGFG